MCPFLWPCNALALGLVMKLVSLQPRSCDCRYKIFTWNASCRLLLASVICYSGDLSHEKSIWITFLAVISIMSIEDLCWSYDIVQKSAYKNEKEEFNDVFTRLIYGLLWAKKNKNFNPIKGELLGSGITNSQLMRKLETSSLTRPLIWNDF